MSDGELGRGKLVVFWLLLAAVALSFVEIGFRALAAWRVGPSIFFYGTPLHRDVASERVDARTVFEHDFEGAGYTKYFPNQRRRDMNPRVGELFDVRINSRGFRGEDFAVDKPPGTIRIVTLGASSTFGYGSREHETYPHVLEGLLHAGCPARASFEVINLGIPHQTSEQILALFRAEALQLDPDVVTFYEGANDTVQVPAMALRASLQQVGPVRELLIFLRSRLMTLRFVDSLLDTRTRTFSAEQVEANLAGKSERFVAALEGLRVECASRGIALVVASQQVQSQTIPGEEIRGVSFADEVAQVEQRLAERGWVGATEQWLLIHSRLMQAQERWAREKGVVYLDLIERLDDDRSILMSWVHPSPEGNRRIAAALAEALLPLTCPGAPSE